MNLNEVNRKRLESLILEHQLTHAAPYLLQNIRQTISCTKADVEDYITPGVSRIGGDPDLPPHIEWPLTTDGVPMTFLTQLNLKECSGHDESSLLPAEGMLYFFVGLDEPAYNIEHRVLFVREDQLAGAERRVAPETTVLEEKFNGYQLDIKASLEAPNYAYVDNDKIENEAVGYEEYEEFGYELSDRQSSEVARMFGYPIGQHDDAEYEAALMLLTNKNYNYSKEKALAQITNHFGGDEAAAMQEVQDTLMLLELESDNDVGFCWWDAGLLHFFIRKEDLLAGNFERTYCSLYSS
ncbi:YwqG family protein [Paenibacillus sp. NPDC057934]|uniref:YwqG family protein n=1 Tax=Paenibacillus sp. NPDC057934 TaxID=3346282 RepID=UPI0036D996F8